MRHKRFKSFFYLFGTTLFFVSCLKDKGNYTYRNIGDPVVVKGIDSLYVVDVLNESLKIEPVITTPDGKPIDTANYTYEWKINQQMGYDNDYPSRIPLSVSPRLEIAKEDMINTISTADIRNRVFAAFSLFFRVTDKKTGLFKDTYFNVIFGSISSKGWLLLCEQNNSSSRLGIVSSLYNDSLVPDVLTATKSTFPTTGRPRFIAVDYQYSFTYPLMGVFPFIGTSTNFALLGPDTLEYKPPIYDLGNFIMGLTTKSDFSTARFYTDGSTHYLYNDGSIYGLLEGWMTEFTPINYFNNSIFHSSEYMALYYSSGLGGYGAIVFNEDTKTFLRNANVSQNCLELPEGTLFDFSTGQHLKYMQYAENFNGGEVFAILQQGSTCNLARFSPAGIQSYYKQILAPDIDKASLFAVDDLFGYIFYSVDGKLYEYNMIDRMARLIHDYGDNKITVLKNFTNNTDMFNKKFGNIVVGTYNKADPGSGTFELYTNPVLNGDVTLVKKITNTGKIVDVVYK